MEMVKSYKFFARKSQHYILGNWSEYEAKKYWFNTWAYPQKAKQYRRYLIRYPRALVKFMWLCYINFVRRINECYEITLINTKGAR